MSIRKVVSVSEAQWELAPAPAWREERTIDWSYVPPAGNSIVALLIDTQYHVATGAVFHRSVRKLLTMSTVQACSQVELEFDPSADRLIIHEVAIWREKNGQWEKRTLDDRGAFLLRQREQQLEQQMLDGRLSVVALLEDVRVGDAIELAWSTVPHEPLPGMRFTAYHVFGWSLPVADCQVTLHLDPAQHVKWRVHTGEGGWEREEEISSDRASWRVKNPPILEYEPNTPGNYWPFHMLDVSGWNTWEEVANFVAELWKDALQFETERVKEEVERLLAGSDPKTAARQAIRMVQEEIRYLAVDFGHGAGIIPNASETVLRRRFGDCKDKSVLLTALLRRLGFEACPVLVAANWRGAVGRLQPSSNAFSHVIVAFKIDGKTHFVDPTVMGLGGDFEHLSPADYQCGLEVRAGVTSLVTIPEPPMAELTLTETFELDRHGGSTVLQEQRMTGWMANAYRGAYIRNDLEAYRKTRLEAFQKIYSTATASPEPPQWEDDFDNNVIVFRVRYLLPSWGDAGKPAPDMFTYGAHGLFLGIENVEGPEKRKHPWAITFPLETHHRVIVQGKCVQKGAPEEINVAGPGFRYLCTVAAEKQRMVFDYKWKASRSEISAKEWPEYLQQRKKAFEQAGTNVATVPFKQSDSWTTLVGKGFAILIALCLLAGLVETMIGKKPRSSATSSSGRQLNGMELLAEARQSMEYRDFDTACFFYKEALQVLPKPGSDFYIQYGLASVEARALTEARESLRKIRETSPASTSADILEARILEAEGQLPRAKEIIFELLLKQPEYPGALAVSARLKERAGDLTDAEYTWESLLRINPHSTEGLLRLGLLRWSRGKKEQADGGIVTPIRQMVTPSPVLESVLSEYYDRTGRSKEAAEAIARAIRFDPQKLILRLRSVQLILKNGDPQRARSEADEMAQRFPGQPATLAAVALSNAAAGDTAKADQAFRSFQEIQPNNPFMQASYGRFLHKTGRLVEAKVMLHGVTAKHPEYGMAWLFYADLLSGIGDYRETAAARQRAEALLSPAEREALLR